MDRLIKSPIVNGSLESPGRIAGPSTPAEQKPIIVTESHQLYGHGLVSTKL